MNAATKFMLRDEGKFAFVVATTVAAKIASALQQQARPMHLTTFLRVCQ